MKLAFLALLMIPFYMGYSQTADLNAGLIQYFPLDNSINDASKNKFIGQTVGILTPVKGYQGMDNTAFDFSQGAIYIPDTLAIPIPFTVSTWLYLDPSSNGFSYYFTKTRTFDMGFSGGSNNSIALRCSLSVYPKYDDRFDVFTSPLVAGTWTPILYEVRTDSILLYVNGNLFQKYNRFQKRSDSLKVDHVTMGGFDGKLDEFRIYNRVLNSAEKRALSDASNPIVTRIDSENDVASPLSIYPNPSNGAMNIAFHSNGSTDLHVSILNTMGVTVLESDYPSQGGITTIPMALTSVEKGVYYLQIKTVGRTFRKKILVE